MPQTPNSSRRIFGRRRRRKDAERERDKATRNLQAAHDAVDRYFTQVSEDRRLAAQGLEPLRRDLLRSAAQFYERFIAQEDRNVGLQFDSSWAKFRLATIMAEVGTPADAAGYFERAVGSFRELVPSKGESGERSRGGILLCQLNLGSLYDRMGQRDKGKAALAEAFATAQLLIQQFPQIDQLEHLLARCFARRLAATSKKENSRRQARPIAMNFACASDCCKRGPG